jgi:hypothetical protein
VAWLSDFDCGFQASQVFLTPEGNHCSYQRNGQWFVQRKLNGTFGVFVGRESFFKLFDRRGTGIKANVLLKAGKINEHSMIPIGRHPVAYQLFSIRGRLPNDLPELLKEFLCGSGKTPDVVVNIADCGGFHLFVVSAGGIPPLFATLKISVSGFV